MSGPYRVLVTGWRDWPGSHAFVIQRALDNIYWDLRVAGETNRRIVVVHGQCPYGGVDLYAHRWAEDHAGADPEPHPADRDAKGRILGPARNSKMVNLGADICLSFPGPGSRGTWDCTEKAVNADIPTRAVPWCSAWAKEWAEDQT